MSIAIPKEYIDVINKYKTTITNNNNYIANLENGNVKLKSDIEEKDKEIMNLREYIKCLNNIIIT
jgi:predicted RNase H-like nuclease (RuvC/YqgF family)